MSFLLDLDLVHDFVAEGAEATEAADEASDGLLLAVAGATRSFCRSILSWHCRQELVGRVVAVVMSTGSRSTVEGRLATGCVALLP